MPGGRAPAEKAEFPAKGATSPPRPVAKGRRPRWCARWSGGLRGAVLLGLAQVAGASLGAAASDGARRGWTATATLATQAAAYETGAHKGLLASAPVETKRRRQEPTVAGVHLLLRRDATTVGVAAGGEQAVSLD